MIELALLLGLGAVGYVLSKDAEPTPASQEHFNSVVAARSTNELHDDVEVVQDKGHNNEVPFFGARVTQTMYSGSADGILDTYTGAGKEYFQKQEVQSMYDSKPGGGQPFGAPNESDFYQSREVTGQRMNNVFPVQQVQVGPGVNDGYTNIPSGGYNQADLREFALPRTTDELRVSTKPKLTYSEPPIPGANKITSPGIQAPVNKHRPDRFAVMGMDHLNTTVGAQTAPKLYSEHVFKDQNREINRQEYTGIAGGQGSTLISSYIRAFTEPFQEFMKLTVEGRPNAGSAQGGNAAGIGPHQYHIQTKKDETVLSDATRFNTPMQIVPAHQEHMGSYRYNEPLQQDRHVARNTPDILSALSKNPYAQSLQSY